MKRFILFVALSALLGIVGLALAAPPTSGPSTTTGKPGTGNQGVTVNTINHTTYKNPGKAFQAIRAYNGMTPKQWIGQWNGPKSTTVGVWIQVQANRANGPYQPAPTP